MMAPGGCCRNLSTTTLVVSLMLLFLFVIGDSLIRDSHKHNHHRTPRDILPKKQIILMNSFLSSTFKKLNINNKPIDKGRINWPFTSTEGYTNMFLTVTSTIEYETSQKMLTRYVASNENFENIVVDPKGIVLLQPDDNLERVKRVSPTPSTGQSHISSDSWVQTLSNLFPSTTNSHEHGSSDTDLSLPFPEMNTSGSLEMVTTSTLFPPTESNGLSTVRNMNYLNYSSNDHHMVLCYHPPMTYSPKFLGYPSNVCARNDKIKTIEFLDTLDMCRTIYNAIYWYREPFFIGVYDLGYTQLNIYYDEFFVKICVPLFRRFDNCEERKFLTICWEASIVFFHSHDCKQPFRDAFLAELVVDNKTKCFEHFCKSIRETDSEINGLFFRLVKSIYFNSTPSCNSLDVIRDHVGGSYNGTLYVAINVHWPCCYAMHMIIWYGNPEAHGLNGSWSYLSRACQACETLLIVLVAVVAVSGVLGNLLVVIVMTSGVHRGQESSMIRTSLAIADLLIALFVVVPSLCYHLTPFFNKPNYIEVPPNETLTNDPFNNTNIIKIAGYFYAKEGYLLFQSILFTTCSNVSLLSLFLLSLERFIMTGRALKYNDYITVRRTKAAIIITWNMSLIYAFGFAVHRDGHLSALRLTFEKLPTGTSGEGPEGLISTIFYNGQILVLLVSGLSTAVFSLLAINNFVQEQNRVAAEWTSLSMRTTSKFHRDNRYILTTMTLMLVFFLVSSLPLTINIIFQSLDYLFYHINIYAYLAWWLFLSASSWNPWLYNFRSQQFMNDAAETWHKMVPARLKVL